MDDPFAPSTDPDIPTPTRDDLLRLLYDGTERSLLAADKLEPGRSETLWQAARRQWDERHKRAAERRAEGEAKQPQVEKIGIPLAGATEEMPPGVNSEFFGTFGDIKPLNDTTTGTRVPGQSASETEHEREQREQRQIEFEVVATMYASHREEYNDPTTPEDHRKAIFQTYRDKLEERKHREAAEFRRKLARIVEAQDWLQSIKDDPKKAHIPRPADDSEEELLKWHEDMSKPGHHVPFPVSADEPPDPVEAQNIPLSTGDNLRTPEEIPLQLEDDLQKMGDAVSSPAEPLQPAPEPQPKVETAVKLDTGEKVSWINRIPVWKEFGHWLKWASASFAFAATMAQLNEYLLAELGLFLCGVCCLAQIYVWTTPKRNVAAKTALAFLSVGLIGVAGLTVYRIKGKKPWSNWLEVNTPTPTGKVQIKDGETVTARIKQWGTSGEHDAFVIVNSIELTPLADDYRLTVICRAQDNKLDAREDLRIDKGAMFTISGTDQRLEVALSQDTMRRLVPQGFINIYVLLVPAKVNTKELRTIKEFTQSGAYVMGNPSMLVHATIENKSGRFAGN